MTHVITAAVPVDHAAAAPARAEPNALAPEQLEAITAARQGAKKISRAASVAAFSGWTIAFFAVISLISGLFGLRAFLLGVALAVVAVVELRGARDLRLLDVGAPRRLALNQIGFAAAVVIYAAWGIVEALTGPGTYDAYIAQGGALAETLEPIDNLTRAVTVSFYGLVIIGSLVAQGGAAIYYATRRRHVANYLERTPSWIVETLRAAV